MPVSPCKKRIISDSAQNPSVGLTVIDTNKQDVKTTSNEESTKSNINMTPPTPGLMAPAYGKSVKSPRRLLLTKRALDQHRVLSEGPPRDRAVELVKKRPVVVLERDGRSMYKAMAPTSCMCYGKPVICSICMARYVLKCTKFKIFISQFHSLYMSYI